MNYTLTFTFLEYPSYSQYLVALFYHILQLLNLLCPVENAHGPASILDSIRFQQMIVFFVSQ